MPTYYYIYYLLQLLLLLLLHTTTLTTLAIRLLSISLTTTCRVSIPQSTGNQHTTTNKQTNLPTTVTMSSSQRGSVYVHQGSLGSSATSSPSRASSTSAQSGSSGSRGGSTRREYDAGMLAISTFPSRGDVLTSSVAGRSARVTETGSNVVVNHHRRDYEPNSPSPRYGGTY